MPSERISVLKERSIWNAGDPGAQSLQTPFQEAREQEPVVAVLNLWVATRENTFLMVLGA